MQEDPRIVLGYHGTHIARAKEIVSSGKFIPSENGYDWLGHGIYFWEHAPFRAWQWAREKYGKEGVVLRASIRLGKCLDLTDLRYTEALTAAYEELREAHILSGSMMPLNRKKARFLDCMVINLVTQRILPECETVRAPFLEGDEIFTGSYLLTQSHIQLVVKKQTCIEPGFQILFKEEE